MNLSVSAGQGAARRLAYERAERAAGREADPDVAARLEANQDLYPNCHVHIWLRSCREEVCRPLPGSVSGEPHSLPGRLFLLPSRHSHSKKIFKNITLSLTGNVPRWLKGTLIRNGPGSLECGDSRFQHLFDGAALLQRYFSSHTSKNALWK